MHLDVEFAKELAKGIDNRTCATHGVVNAPLALKVVDQHIERGRIKGIAANQQRVKGEAAAQEFVVNKLADIVIDAAVRAKADEVGRHLEHVRDMQKGLVDKIHARGKDFARRGHEAVVTVGVGGIPLADLIEDEFVIVVVAKATACMIKDAVKGIHRLQRKVVLAPLARQRPDFIKEPGRGDDGGAAVKLEAVDFVGVGAAAQLVALFKKFDIVAGRRQTRRGRQPAKTAADDHNFLFHAGFLSWPGGLARCVQRFVRLGTQALRTFILCFWQL